MRFYMNNGVAEIQGENRKVRTHRSENNCGSAQKLLFFCHDIFVFSGQASYTAKR